MCHFLFGVHTSHYTLTNRWSMQSFLLQLVSSTDSEPSRPTSSPRAWPSLSRFSMVVLRMPWTPSWTTRSWLPRSLLACTSFTAKWIARQCAHWRNDSLSWRFRLPRILSQIFVTTKTINDIATIDNKGSCDATDYRVPIQSTWD